MVCFTLTVPTFPPETMKNASDEEWRAHAFLAVAALLPIITEDNWPGHAVLPKWSELRQRYSAVSPKDQLDSYMAGLPERLPIKNWQAPKTVVRMCFGVY